MKKQGTGDREQGTENADLEAATVAGTEAAVEVKPKVKARKKKVAEPIEDEATEVVTAKTDDPGPTPKPAKKAAKKTKTAVVEAEAEVRTEAVAESVAEAPKARKTAKPKKDKGPDLVADEPGAAEVASVLGEHSDEPEVSFDADRDVAGADDSVKEAPSAKGPEPKLERLQKILAKAGISSRRKAEELILGGQVQINGKVVTELGTKADPSRDHIRVNGKLLQGPERIRYFVLNKPKGYVTTVSDPENRPTVMQIFDGERERLYPVGRLDYLSEGLLLVTNDGELANKLTKAATGVEKTYLVKVSGQPTEEELDQLRGGVAIDRTKPGEGRVHTAPASIRQVREGDNPWYEVVLTEGRNRELRKMFEEIGHFVEKIRRVGYGPLVLDQEPGNLRELDADELASLRLAAEGKWRKPKPREPKTREFRRSESRPAPGRGPGRKPVGEFRGRAGYDRSDRPAASRPARQDGEW